MNTDIICRWRDAITDPPPDGYYQLSGDGANSLWCSYIDGRWADDSSGMPVDLQPGDQWLDVTTIPAVPLAQVQAAVDEIVAGIERCENNICNGADANIGTMAIRAYQDALDEIRNHTGVTPSEVTP